MQSIAFPVACGILKLTSGALVVRTPPINAMLLSGLLLGVGLAGCGPANNAAQTAKKKLTRDEFKALVDGKTRAEVIAAVGKPSKTEQYGDGKEMWYFKDAAIDPITQKSGSVFVHFDKEPGKVNEISFN